MAYASLDGTTIAIAPSSLSWTCNMNTHPTNTYGGKVIQILACYVSQITLGGYISGKDSNNNMLSFNNRYENMEAFEGWIKGLMEYSESCSFVYNPRNITADVFVADYSGLSYDDTTNTRQYTLTLNVDRGATALALQTEISETTSYATLEGEINGAGWTRSSYTYVSETADATDLSTFWSALEKAYTDAGNYSSTGESLEQIVMDAYSREISSNSSTTNSSTADNTNYISAQDIFKTYFGAVPADSYTVGS